MNNAGNIYSPGTVKHGPPPAAAAAVSQLLYSPHFRYTRGKDGWEFKVN